MSWPTPEDIQTRLGIKGMVLLGALGLALAGGIAFVAHQQHKLAQGEVERKALKEVARAAGERETAAKAETAVAKDAEARALAKAREAQARLDALPHDPGPRPVSPDAPVSLVVSELRGMGIAPVVLGENPALGMTLPDSRTVLFWGREAQRVGPLAARLEAATALAQAQAGVADTRLQQVASLTTALDAADLRASAQERRADSAEADLRRVGKLRPWTVGGLVAVDVDGRQHLGAYVSWSYRAVNVHAVFVNRTVAVGAGIRF